MSKNYSNNTNATNHTTSLEDRFSSSRNCGSKNSQNKNCKNKATQNKTSQSCNLRETRDDLD